MLTLISVRSHASNAILDFIHLFHIPVFVSGLFAQSAYQQETGLDAIT